MSKTVTSTIFVERENQMDHLMDELEIEVKGKYEVSDPEDIDLIGSTHNDTPFDLTQEEKDKACDLLCETARDVLFDDDDYEFSYFV